MGLIDPHWCGNTPETMPGDIYPRDEPRITTLVAMQSETAFPSSVNGAAIAGFEELSGGIRYWRVSHLIGIRELTASLCALEARAVLADVIDCQHDRDPGGGLVAAVESADPRTGAVYRRGPHHMELPVASAH